METKIQLGQLSSFTTILEEDEHFDIFEIDMKRLKEMSEKQYKGVLHKIFSNEYDEAKEELGKFLNHK